MSESVTSLKKAIRPIHLWAIAVGLVISGEYFGWNYGWGVAGTVGFLIATLIITVLYITFILALPNSLLPYPMRAALLLIPTKLSVPGRPGSWLCYPGRVPAGHPCYRLCAGQLCSFPLPFPAGIVDGYWLLCGVYRHQPARH